MDRRSYDFNQCLWLYLECGAGCSLWRAHVLAHQNLMQFTGNGVVTTYNDRKPFVIPNSARAIRDNNGNIVSYVENTTPVKMSDSSYQTYLTTMVTAMGDWPIWQTVLTPNCVISPFLGSCRRSGSIQSISAVYQSLLS